jgi:hypothetical protein
MSTSAGTRSKRARTTWLALALLACCGAARAGEQPPAGLSPADWSQLKGSIEAASYRVQPATRASGSELLAANAKQRYRTTFGREGIEIAAAHSDGTSWRWR